MNDSRIISKFDALVNSTYARSWGGRKQRFSVTHVLVHLLFLVSLLLLLKTANAEPYLPQDENLVLDQLPETLTSNRIDILVSKLKQRTLNKEQYETLQASLISTYIAQAKSTGDMRYISYAQNRLQQWLQEVPESEQPRLLSAYLQQYNHKFTEAIEELESLLTDYPENIGAWSLLANMQLLTGNYQSAKYSCKQLAASSDLIEAIFCQSNIMIRTGLLDKAYQMLIVLLSATQKMPFQQQLWLHTSLAEIKIQQGDTRTSSIHIEYAMNLAEDNNAYDGYLMRLYIDHLVQDNRLEEAFLLAQKNKNDIALMVRVAVLAKKLGNETIFFKNRTALMQIFDVEKRRGQSRHLREQALFTLLVQNNPVVALDLAQQNWVLQKEPEDARILMKSALATDELMADIAQLQQAEAAVKKIGLIDRRLDKSRLQNSLL